MTNIVPLSSKFTVKIFFSFTNLPEINRIQIFFLAIEIKIN